MPSKKQKVNFKAKSSVPSPLECQLASCWTGRNASKRMMNILSPKMPTSKFNEYVHWMRATRGCTTAHVILCNQGDGEYAGYTPFGSGWGSAVNPAVCQTMISRMAAIRAYGMAVVPWCVTDDSPSFTGRTTAEWKTAITQFKAAGLFDVASYAVLGLELNEYWGKAKVQELATHLQATTMLWVGVHQTSNRYDYAPYCNIFLWQTEPGQRASAITAKVGQVVRAISPTPVVAFELDRKENRSLCNAAFAGGAIAVGNW